jgi:hypothetical protein
MEKIVLADRGTVILPVWTAETGGTGLLAAQELARFLGGISGTSYPLLSGGKAPAGCITVAGSADQSLGKEGFTIKTGPAGVRIEGGLPRGVLYGVYDFLERLGCRWWSSTASQIPRRARLEASVMDVREVPLLEYRDINSVDASDAFFALRNRFNGQCSSLTPALGGKLTYYPFVHTFNTLIPADTYFDSHPEYFSMVDGKRFRDEDPTHTQLCLTNPEVKRLAVEAVEKWIAEHPEAAIFSISQNDWHNPCGCPECKKIDDAEGSHAGTLIHFVNHIAEAVEKKYPDVIIDTLAYQYTRTPPKTVRPRHNVCVRLCSIECCFFHPLRVDKDVLTTDNKDSFQKNLEDWSKVCGRLYIWDYVVHYGHYLLPWPNFRVLADNIRFFIENNVKGVFEEAAVTPYGGTEFAELRAWVLGKLLWNPYQDTDRLVNEFLTGYYRQAADPIREYFYMIHEHIAGNPNRHLGIWQVPPDDYLSPEIAQKSFDLFGRALALADDEEILRRVRIAQLPIRYWEIYKMPLDKPERPVMVEKLFADLMELGVHCIREHASIKESRKRMDEGTP